MTSETETKTVAFELSDLELMAKACGGLQAETILVMIQRIAAAHAREVAAWEGIRNVQAEMQRYKSQKLAEQIHTCSPFCEREACKNARDKVRIDWLSQSSNLQNEMVLHGYGSLRDRIDDAMPRVEVEG